jgi:hypothetical protein
MDINGQPVNYTERVSLLEAEMVFAFQNGNRCGITELLSILNSVLHKSPDNMSLHTEFTYCLLGDLTRVDLEGCAPCQLEISVLWSSSFFENIAGIGLISSSGESKVYDAVHGNLRCNVPKRLSMREARKLFCTIPNHINETIKREVFDNRASLHLHLIVSTCVRRCFNFFKFDMRKELHNSS